MLRRNALHIALAAALSVAVPVDVRASETSRCARLMENRAASCHGAVFPSTRAILESFGTLGLPVAGLGSMRMWHFTLNHQIELTISGDVYDYNIHTQALAAYPDTATEAVDVILTINTTRNVYSTDVPPSSAFAAATYWALATGTGWLAGSTIKVINNGKIWGAGGLGGRGSDFFGDSPIDGSSGGHAILLDWPIILDNTNGYIYGGGGGGGGGQGYHAGLGWASGGGGGAGAGTNRGAVGAAGTYGSPGAGSDASGTVGGLGGPGGYDAFYGLTGGKGGNAGSVGQDGSNGSPAPSDPSSFGGGAGGYAGRAIYKQGYTVTWLGGNNSSQVKGAVA